eukprot:TRINITY_DN293_c0_g1_i2.p1 TRINITY_DN293_c0_g1~~TRINITY_DN293_c0_g1_i2.p1  ORF type:complete len:590 (-),score=134.28 TRINITY_DN293_c0_g1_i2:239-2008(-)
MSGADAFFVAAANSAFLPKQAKTEQNLVDLAALFECYERDHSGVLTTGDLERMFRDFLHCFSRSVVAIPEKAVDGICNCVFGFAFSKLKKKLAAIVLPISKVVKKETGNKDELKALVEFIGVFAEMPSVMNKREFGKVLGETLFSFRTTLFKYCAYTGTPIAGNVLSEFFARGLSEITRNFKKQITAAYKMEDRREDSEDGDEPVEAYEKRWREGAKQLAADMKELFNVPHGWILGPDLGSTGNFDVDGLDTYEAMSALENLYDPFKGIVFIGKFFALDKLTEKWNAAKSADGTVDGEVYLDFVTALLSDWLDKLPEAARKAYRLVDMRSVDDVDELREKLNVPEPLKISELEIPCAKKTTYEEVSALLSKLFVDHDCSGDVMFIIRNKVEEEEEQDQDEQEAEGAGEGEAVVKPVYKMTFVGDTKAGKTCMAISYATNMFPDEFVPTVFDNITTHLVVDEKDVILQLWDTAGDEDYDRLRPLSYPETDIFLLCFKISSRSQFSNIETRWLPELRHFQPSAIVLLVGTAADSSDRAVAPEQAHALVGEQGVVDYVECSAKTQEGLKEVFERAVRLVRMPRRKARKGGKK